MAIGLTSKAHAQTNVFVARRTGVGAPVGTCTFGIDYLDTTTVPGNLYTCPVNGGSYVLSSNVVSVISTFGQTGAITALNLSTGNSLAQTGTGLLNGVCAA